MGLTNRQWLASEPYTLALGAGFFGFFAHTGVLRALEGAGLPPAKVVGVSAGALAGGLWASGIGADDLATELTGLRRDQFWDPGVPLGGLLRGRKFAAKLRNLIATTGVDRVETCPTPFRSVVHDVLRNRPLAVDHGSLVRAIHASCAVPLMFRPVWTRRGPWVDGGVSDRAGMTAVQPGERLLVHYLPSRRRIRLRRPSPPPPAGPRCTVMVVPDLPAVGPYALAAGPRALRIAHEHVQRWLDGPAQRSG